MQFRNLRVVKILNLKHNFNFPVKQYLSGEYGIECLESDYTDSKMITFSVSRSRFKKILKLLVHHGKDAIKYFKTLDKIPVLDFTPGNFPLIKFLEIDDVKIHEEKFIFGNPASIECYNDVIDEEAQLTYEDIVLRQKIKMLATGDIRYLPVDKNIAKILQDNGYYYLKGTVRQDGKVTTIRVPFPHCSRYKSLPEDMKQPAMLDEIPADNTAAVFDADKIYKKKEEIIEQKPEEKLEAAA